jgi:hypothetical protein
MIPSGGLAAIKGPNFEKVAAIVFYIYYKAQNCKAEHTT